MISHCVSALDKHNHISSHLPNSLLHRDTHTHTHTLSSSPVSPTLTSTVDDSKPLAVRPALMSGADACRRWGCGGRHGGGVHVHRHTPAIKVHLFINSNHNLYPIWRVSPDPDHRLLTINNLVLISRLHKFLNCEHRIPIFFKNYVVCMLSCSYKCYCNCT